MCIPLSKVIHNHAQRTWLYTSDFRISTTWIYLAHTTPRYINVQVQSLSPIHWMMAFLIWMTYSSNFLVVFLKYTIPYNSFWIVMGSVRISWFRPSKGVENIFSAHSQQAMLRWAANSVDSEKALAWSTCWARVQTAAPAGRWSAFWLVVWKPSIKILPFLTGEDGDDFQYFHGKFGDFKGKPMNFPSFWTLNGLLLVLQVWWNTAKRDVSGKSMMKHVLLACLRPPKKRACGFPKRQGLMKLCGMFFQNW